MSKLTPNITMLLGDLALPPTPGYAYLLSGMNYTSVAVKQYGIELQARSDDIESLSGEFLSCFSCDGIIYGNKYNYLILLANKYLNAFGYHGC